MKHAMKSLCSKGTERLVLVPDRVGAFYVSLPNRMSSAKDYQSVDDVERRRVKEEEKTRRKVSNVDNIHLFVD